MAIIRPDVRRDMITRAGREAFANYGESGEGACPYDHGPPMDERRTWWMDGFIAERTRTRLEKKGVSP